MLMLKLFFSFWVIFFSFQVYSQTRPRSPASRVPDIAVSLTSGVSQFSSLEIPYEFSGTEQLVNAQGSHTGLPVGFEISKNLQRRRDIYVGLEGLSVTGVAIPKSRQASGYKRLNIMTGARRLARLGNVYLGAHLSLRRQAFMNVSTGHNLESALLGGSASYGRGRWLFEGSAFVPTYSRFGFNNGKNFFGQSLNQTAASVWAFEAQSHYHIGSQAYLTLDYNWELSQVRVQNFEVYQEYGLARPAGFPGDNISMNYYLDVQNVTFGLEKRW
jgi:hypothetical protein